MYRTWVIARHTFVEAISQPIYALLLGFGAAILVVFMFLPFFTLGEDAIMYKDVCLDVITLLILLTTLFATSKSIHEEIEDRTMLTLMSKPVSRFEVLVGKYLGLIGSALLGVAALGALLCICTWWRIPSDYMLNTRSVDVGEMENLSHLRQAHLSGLYPSLLLIWMQISVLAALSVAISTRFSLVVNLPVVILLYLAGNLTRFIDDAIYDWSAVPKLIAQALASLLPFLEVFDIKKYAIFGQIGLGSGQTLESRTGATLGFMWRNTALAGVYALCYVSAALSLGLLVFRNRELGGSEG